MEIVCFHNPGEENGYLSNWYPSTFTTEGMCFSSMEQYMMYNKAIMFGDAAIAERIIATADAAEIKALGREVRNYNDLIWSGCRQIVVYKGLIEKFRQNSELKKYLLSTGKAVLAECAVKDRIWGIGLSMRDPDRMDMEKWQGRNLLGFALMEVRESLN
jgi:ribA/ribD-fused uncharacterized protein